MESKVAMIANKIIRMVISMVGINIVFVGKKGPWHPTVTAENIGCFIFIYVK